MYQLGIDVSKKTLDICLMREGVRGRLKTKKVKNDFKAVHIITEWLEHHNCAPSDAHIIMEATGVYHELLCISIMPERMFHFLDEYVWVFHACIAILDILV